MTHFKSDFSMFPISKIGRPGWEYRKATWPMDIDKEVHKLYNDEITGPIFYDRARFKDGVIERCEILKNDNDEIIVSPPNKFNYLVRIDSMNNIIKNDNDNGIANDNSDCAICFTNKRTHIVKECNHLIMCQECAIAVFNTSKQCPSCRAEMKVPPKKVFF